MILPDPQSQQQDFFSELCSEASTLPHNIYSKLLILGWADVNVNKATHRAFLGAYLQPLQLEKSTSCLFPSSQNTRRTTFCDSSDNLSRSRQTGDNKGDFQPCPHVLAMLLRIYEHSSFYNKQGKCRGCNWRPNAEPVIEVTQKSEM